MRMTISEFEARERTFAEVSQRRDRRLLFAAALIGVATLVALLATFRLGRDSTQPVLIVLLGAMALLALYVAVSSKTHFAPYQVRCGSCGRSLIGMFYYELYEPEKGKGPADTLTCHKCGAIVATRAS